MECSDINPFLALFCKELSFHLDNISARQKTISANDFSEVVSTVTREVLESFNNGEFDLQEYRKTASSDEYKQIALHGIDSYAASNKAIEKIADNHATILDESSTTCTIDFAAISEKFNDIQSHLKDEVSHANQIIRELNARVKNLEMKTTLDPLTKTYNRNALQEHLLAILSKESVSPDIFVMMVDVDNFKQINDQYGHIAGDKVLIFITKLFKKALRDGDRIYRFGGEEFIVLLNRTDLEGAQLAGSRLLSLCRQNKPLYQNEQISVTLSIGLTDIKPNDTVDTIIHRSDTALYRAKSDGKDRMEMEF